MTSLPRLLCALSLTLALGPGCYRSHRSDEGDGSILRRDAGRDAPLRDGETPPDVPPRRDGSIDGGDELDDVGPDARRDAPLPMGPDAEPPVEGPPDPSTCRIEPVIEPFRDPVLEVRWPGAGFIDDPASVHVCATPLVIDLDPHDGPDLDPVVVFTSYESIGSGGILRIWNPRTDETISWPTDVWASRVLEESTNLAAGDLDGDGFNEIVGMGVDQGSYAFTHDGELFWSSPYPTAVERGLGWNLTIGGAVAFADLEGDGTVEVILGRTVLEGRTGAHRFTASSDFTTRGANGQIGPISCVADLDGDGEQEIIAGRSAIRADGSLMWENHDAVDGFCAIGEIVATSAGPEVALVSSSYVYILSARGETLWQRLIEGSGATFGSGGPPTIGDFDGDGRAELAIANGAAYGVYDLDCTARGIPDPGCGNAGVRWTQPTEDASSASTGSSLFDFNGDGRAEVLYNDQFFFRVYDGGSGTELYAWENSSRTRTENPVVADVDADGDAEIIFSANSDARFLMVPHDRRTDPGVEIWGDAMGRWVGARRIWNQHSYHVTNVNEDGSIPTHETPSWTVLNAYRQNLREGADVLVVPDLWGGRGTYECLGGNRVRMTLTVANYGLERAGAGIVIALFRGDPDRGGERIAETATTNILLPEGGSETVSFDVTLEGDVEDYWAVIDAPEDLPAGGSVYECREANNRVLFWRPICR